MANPYAYLVEKIVELVDANSLKSICDYGCGKGELLNLLSNRLDKDVSLTGIDYFEHLSKNHRPVSDRIKYIDKNSKEIEVIIETDGKYDLVVSSFALHHYQYPIYELKSIYNLTTPSGYNLFLDTNFQNNNDAQMITNIHTFDSEIFTSFMGKYHRHHYTLDEAIDIISSNRVHIIEAKTKKFDFTHDEREKDSADALRHVDNSLEICNGLDSPILKNYLKMILGYERNLIGDYGIDYSQVFIIVTRKI